MKVCSRCGESYEIGNAFHKLCYKCNDIRLKDSKSFKKPLVSERIDTTKKSFNKVRRPVTTFKTNATKVKHEAINPYNVKGEKELFAIIWEKRPHVCVNKDCGKRLDEEAKAHYFSHRVAKSIAPCRRLDPSNIDLLCIECHTEHDFGKRKLTLPKEEN